jgi:DNA invertase Pin-like site-specific DNA recombinase
LLSRAGGGLIDDTPTDEEAPVWRVAIYAREAAGRAGRNRLNRQVAGLATQVVRQWGWRHVATYGDQDFGVGRPGLSRLLAEAPRRVDLLVVDGYGRLSSNRHELNALLAQLGGAGVRVVVLRPSTGRRLARMVANLALADVIASAAR